MAWFRTSGDNGGSLKVKTASGDIASFETNLVAPYQSVIVDVEATGGNGTPDNPNPIVGYSSANITRCGVNLFDKTNIFEGYINDTNGNYSPNANYKCTDFIPVKGGLDYYIKSEQRGSNWGAWYDSEKNYIGVLNAYANRVKTSPVNACFARLTIWGTNEGGNVDTFGFNYPATDTAYHPYNGQTYTVNFGQTVYGGQLDVTRGKLHVTHLYKAYDGTEAWYISGASGGEYRMSLAEVLDNVKYPTTNDEVLSCICNMFEEKTANQTYARNQGISYQSGNGLRIYANDYNTSDITPWKTLLTNTPLQVVYELATPFDIDLTPEVISAIVGENNVFADCGQTTVKYLKRE